MSSSSSRDPAGSGLARDVTEPLAAAVDCGRVLPGQIARFGELAGRELSARAFAAPRARGTCDAGTCQPLTAAEQLEMAALRAAITGGLWPVALADAAGTQGPGPPGGLPRPVRLRRLLSPNPGRLAGRHHRAAGKP